MLKEKSEQTLEKFKTSKSRFEMQVVLYIM